MEVNEVKEKFRAGKVRARRAILRVAFAVLGLMASLLSTPLLLAQGCIVARSPEQVMPGVDQSELPSSQGGYLLPGHFQFTLGERHQFSYLHYVGDVYQQQRATEHTEVQNRINLLDFDLAWQWTPRLGLELNAPLLFASRKQQSSPIEYQASGLGDLIVAANMWILSPAKPHRGNVSLGLGVLMPSGNDDVQNTVNTNNSGVGAPVLVTAPVDYSIQPGNGGWGMVIQWQGFVTMNRRFLFYADGDYIASQGNTNGVLRGATTSSSQPLDNYVARSDQYLLESGFAYPMPLLHGLTATFGPRDEGVPAHNLFPNSNDGFRRPGFAVSVGPGFEYSRGPSILTAGVFKAVHRDRTVSYPDSVYGTHGDAAFASYVWLTTYTIRF
jgi:hypothetical protein